MLDVCAMSACDVCVVCVCVRVCRGRSHRREFMTNPVSHRLPQALVATLTRDEQVLLNVTAFKSSKETDANELARSILSSFETFHALKS
jgi:hypothetical protein